MNSELGILLPAFLAGLLVLATHIPFGMRVLQRGVIFADLAVAWVRQEYPNKIDYEPSGEDFLPVLEIADKRRRR